jgi:spore coat polysaccharide biosynthesis protein SpsF
LIAEYYSPQPTMMIYRGKRNKLFKRDFAGEFVSLFKKTKIVKYGFAYHKDKHPQDDLNWFLIKKYG